MLVNLTLKMDVGEHIAKVEGSIERSGSLIRISASLGPNRLDGFRHIDSFAFSTAVPVDL
jgi:hypothetical protein